MARAGARAAASLEAELKELLAFYDCPAAHPRKLRATNSIERLFVEVRRRIRTLCAFAAPSRCERILFGVFARMNAHRSREPLKPFTQSP